jgi:hypothetical protein
VQSDTATLPAGADEFAGHSEHAVAPPPAKVASAHTSQRSAPAPENAPAAHAAQALAAVAPVAARYVPAAHALHAAEPDAFLKVPCGHDAHGPPAGPLRPAWHTQLVCWPLPPAELAPSGHGTHALADVAALASRNVPAAHALHAAEPDAFLKVPGGHDAHGPPAGPL